MAFPLLHVETIIKKRRVSIAPNAIGLQLLRQ
jgi:hypothetical protein